jgi:hypothetical protein
MLNEAGIFRMLSLQKVQMVATSYFARAARNSAIGTPFCRKSWRANRFITELLGIYCRSRQRGQSEKI